MAHSLLDAYVFLIIGPWRRRAQGHLKVHHKAYWQIFSASAEADGGLLILVPDSASAILLLHELKGKIQYNSCIRDKATHADQLCYLDVAKNGVRAFMQRA